jgi:hypothetical protein
MGMALCGLATIVAIPVLWMSRGSSAGDATIDAGAAVSTTVAADPTSLGTTGSSDATAATASSLLDEVDHRGLLDGGADPAGARAAQAAPDDAVVALDVAVPTTGSELANRRWTTQTTGPGPEAPTIVDPQSSPAAASGSALPGTTTTGPPTTPAPTTAPRPTAPPTTAAPTTAAPTSAAPAVAAPVTAAPTTAPPAAGPPSATDAAPSPGEPTPQQWAALRACEAGGSYTIVSSNGRFHGAYQFAPGTWDRVAAAAGRDDLVGVLPSEAAPGDQDALAYFLWTLEGWSPWPACSAAINAA